MIDATKTVITVKDQVSNEKGTTVTVDMHVPAGITKATVKKTVSQLTIVAKICKAFPKGYRINQELLNQIIRLADATIAYNANLLKEDQPK